MAGLPMIRLEHRPSERCMRSVMILSLTLVAALANSSAGQAQDAQPTPLSVWSFGGTIGVGYVAGEGGKVMRSPRLIAGSIQRRVGYSPWWIGVEAFELRARPTSTGMDILRTHAGPAYTNDEQRAYYNTKIGSLLCGTTCPRMACSRNTRSPASGW